MGTCSVVRKLEIVRGVRADYDKLSRYHYRAERLGVYAAVFALRGRFRTAVRLETVGVIVYTMPVVGCELRDVATGGFFAGYDRETRLALLNKNVRCISRVVIEPRFRGLGLAARLVRETMGLMDVPIVEAMAVMGRVNPFFERAGMSRYEGALPARCVRLMEAFGTVGIEADELVDAAAVHNKLEILRCAQNDNKGAQNDRRGAGDKKGQAWAFVDDEMRRFLRSYGKRRGMKGGIERVRYVLGKLTERCVYYLWQNEGAKLPL